MSMAGDPAEILTHSTWVLARSGEDILDVDDRWQRPSRDYLATITDPAMLSMLDPEGFDDPIEAARMFEVQMAGYTAGRVMLGTADTARPWPREVDPNETADRLFDLLHEMDIALLPHGRTGEWLDMLGAAEEDSLIAPAFDSSLALALLEHDRFGEQPA
jgi:hypothetical protein